MCPKRNRIGTIEKIVMEAEEEIKQVPDVTWVVLEREKIRQDAYLKIREYLFPEEYKGGFDDKNE